MANSFNLQIICATMKLFDQPASASEILSNIAALYGKKQKELKSIVNMALETGVECGLLQRKNRKYSVDEVRLAHCTMSQTKAVAPQGENNEENNDGRRARFASSFVDLLNNLVEEQSKQPRKKLRAVGKKTAAQPPAPAPAPEPEPIGDDKKATTPEPEKKVEVKSEEPKKDENNSEENPQAARKALKRKASADPSGGVNPKRAKRKE